MAATVELINPRNIIQNPDNPRLIFHEDELLALADSIREQGILVPLTVFKQGKQYTLLDGERRWRCARRLGLGQVPVIVQEKPDRVTNIMMMFAIHNARQDWDPLATALKLEELEKILTKALGEPPTEKRLAAAASLRLGEVRRYKKILALPTSLRKDLKSELGKPRSEQRLTVDHVIEAVSGVGRIAKAEIIDASEKDDLVKLIAHKFREGVLRSTVEPRRLSRIARAVERKEVTPTQVRAELKKFETQPKYTIEKIFERTVEQADFSHGTEQIVRRALTRLEEMSSRDIQIADELRSLLKEIQIKIKSMLAD